MSSTASHETADLLSQMSISDTMEEENAISEEAKTDPKEVIGAAIDLSMAYRDPGFELESIR